MTTNVPKPVFGPNGFVVPAEKDIWIGRMADFNDAFDGQLNTDANNPTPQNQLVTSDTAIIGNVNDTFLFLASQVDPAYSTGRMQDAIARIYFLARKPAQATVVQVVCTGLAGTPIPVGSIVKADDGNLYTSTQAGVIANGGSVTLSFACNVVGPVACPANSINKIYRAIPGWDAVSNPSAGVVGTNVESAQAFEARRFQTVAANSVGMLSSILGAVLAVPGVIEAYVTENDSDLPDTIDGVTLAPHSVYVAVVGGNTADVAFAIWSKKAPGCAYNGNTTVTVYDKSKPYAPPYPQYQVKFQIPQSLPILFAVTLTNNPQVPGDALTQIQNAIINAFNGTSGGNRAGIGATLYATNYMAAVQALGQWVQLVSLQVGAPNNPDAATVTGSIAGTVMTVTAVASGTLAVGQNVFDSLGHIMAGTVITNQASGTPGGVGVYTLNNNVGTISSGTLIAATADQIQVPVGIAHTPTLDPNNIKVTLV